MLDWKKYISIANRFQYKAKPQDRDDLRHDIILSLAQAERRGPGRRQLSHLAMLRIAQYECQKYYRRLRRHHREISLSTVMYGGNGNVVELGDTLPDESLIDLDACLDARSRLLNCPRRLVLIGGKIICGIPLSNSEHQYLYRFRKSSQRGGNGEHKGV